MKTNRLQVLAWALIPICALLFSGLSGAADEDQSVTPAEAREISKNGFLFGVPVVYIDLSAEVGSNVPEPQGRRSPRNQFAHYRDFPDASSREVVGPNRDTLYSFAWIDLSAEPLVLSVPEMGDRYWSMMVLDAWNDVPASPGSRTVGGKGGNFVIAGPNWSGEIPSGSHSTFEFRPTSALSPAEPIRPVRLMMLPRFTLYRISTY